VSGSARKRVAVVDDDPRVLESLQDLLESAGYDVRVYSSGALLLSGGVADVDCLITDVGMLEMDGFELRERVRLLRAELPVFLISGRNDLTEDDRLGASEFFRKPFDGSILLTAIHEAVRGRTR